MRTTWGLRNRFRARINRRRDPGRILRNLGASIICLYLPLRWPETDLLAIGLLGIILGHSAFLVARIVDYEDTVWDNEQNR